MAQTGRGNTPRTPRTPRSARGQESDGSEKGNPLIRFQIIASQTYALSRLSIGNVLFAFYQREKRSGSAETAGQILEVAKEHERNLRIRALDFLLGDHISADQAWLKKPIYRQLYSLWDGLDTFDSRPEINEGMEDIRIGDILCRMKEDASGGEGQEAVAKIDRLALHLHRELHEKAVNVLRPNGLIQRDSEFVGLEGAMHSTFLELYEGRKRPGRQLRRGPIGDGTYAHKSRVWSWALVGVALLLRLIVLLDIPAPIPCPILIQVAGALMMLVGFYLNPDEPRLAIMGSAIAWVGAGAFTALLLFRAGTLHPALTIVPDVLSGVSALIALYSFWSWGPFSWAARRKLSAVRLSERTRVDMRFGLLSTAFASALCGMALLIGVPVALMGAAPSCRARSCISKATAAKNGFDIAPFLLNSSPLDLPAHCPLPKVMYKKRSGGWGALSEELGTMKVEGLTVHTNAIPRKGPYEIAVTCMDVMAHMTKCEGQLAFSHSCVGTPSSTSTSGKDVPVEYWPPHGDVVIVAIASTSASLILAALFSLLLYRYSQRVKEEDFADEPETDRRGLLRGDDSDSDSGL